MLLPLEHVDMCCFVHSIPIQDSNHPVKLNPDALKRPDTLAVEIVDLF